MIQGTSDSFWPENTPARQRIRRGETSGSVGWGFVGVSPRMRVRRPESFRRARGYTSSATPHAGRMVMSRKGSSRGAFGTAAMLVALALLLSATARAQQPDASQGTPAAGQDNVDAAQI